MSSDRPPSSGSDGLAIVARDLSKTYRIWDRPSSRLTAPALELAALAFPENSAAARLMRRRAQAHFRDFESLRNITLEVAPGESCGIIGRNGSGKSTLLQILAGTLQPSSGSFMVSGRVAALLELGSGFNTEFTGRENVLMNASILGLNREIINQRLEAIIDYADIGTFIDEPVKTYSSGMQMRLAFAVAVHVDADILIIDEALSVGDARFQLKCARTLDRFREEGRTLLFVSHDLSSVKRLCTRALLLERGRNLYLGSPNDVANLYSKLLADGGSADSLTDDISELHRKAAAETVSSGTRVDNGPKTPLAAASEARAPSVPEKLSMLQLRVAALETVLRTQQAAPELDAKVQALLASERTVNPSSGREFTYGGNQGRIHDIGVLDAMGNLRTWFDTGEIITVRMRVEAFESLPEPIFALTIRNNTGMDVYATNTLFGRQPTDALAPGEHREVDFVMPLNLMPGVYFLSFGFTQFVGENLAVIHRRYDAIQLDVHKVDQTFGIANLWARITTRPVSMSMTSKVS